MGRIQVMISVAADRPLVSNRVWTIPERLSFLRLLGVPFFLALILL
jgi:hypothetical protein